MHSQGEDPESSAIGARIDQLCDRFQTAWKSGTPPDLATYLLEIEEASRQLAFRQLLPVELQMRRARGEPPTLDDYQRRFLDEALVVADVFQSFRRDKLANIDAPLAHVTTGFHVRCPHCHNPIELVTDADLSEIECKSCGGSFSLTGTDQASLQAGTANRIGHFELIERLGMGAFGSVWRARDTKLDRTVAVKIPRKGQLDATETEMFLREARSAAQLRHPNIVSVHEVGRDNDSVYLVSDLISGMSLDKWIAEQRLAPREAAEICAKIADALQHAHERGVIHRDLKPQNVLMDADGQPHLTDFGLAKREAGEITMTMEGQLLGTPAYMSPEQARGEAHVADKRSDVYSLGVVLFQLLTGELPFRGNVRMLLKQVLEDDAPAPRQLDNRVPRDLDTICQKCMAKEPARRYQTARALADDLQKFLRSEPILARPISRAERAWRWCRRKPVVAGLSAAVVALLTFLAIAGPIIAVQQAASRARAETETAKALFSLGNAEYSAGQVQSACEDLFHAWILCSEKNPLKPGYGRVLADRLTRGQRSYVLVLHNKRVWSVAFSPDGRHILTGSADNTARLWESTTGQPLGQPMHHKGEVHSVAFSPDGKRVLTGADDSTARLWDATTGEPLGEPIRHAGPIWSVAFSPDGRHILTGSYDNTARLWDATTGEPLGQPMHHAKAVLSIAFSPDGKYILTGSNDKTARVWNAVNGEPLGEPMRHKGAVTCVVFSRDNKRILTGSAGDQTTQLWDANTGQPLGEPIHYASMVMSVAFSPDGQYILTGSFDNTARVWNATTGQPIGQPMRHAGEVTSVAFSPDGQYILTGGYDKTARIWDAPMNLPLGGRMHHQDEVLAVAFSPDGRRVLTGSFDNTARLWDATTGQPVGEPQRHTGPVHSVAFSPDGKRVVTGSYDNSARLWDAATGQPLGVPMHHDDRVMSVAFSPDGQHVLTASYHTLRLWDGATSQPLGAPKYQNAMVMSLAFSPDGQHVLTGSEDKLARLFDAATGKSIGVSMYHDLIISSVAFSPDGERVLTGSYDNTARLWDAATGQPLGIPMHHDDKVRSVAFSPDGERVLTGSADKTARLWDAWFVPVPRDKLAWFELLLSKKLDDSGQTVDLSTEEVAARWKKLESDPAWIDAIHEFQELRATKVIDVPKAPTLGTAPVRRQSSSNALQTPDLEVAAKTIAPRRIIVGEAANGLFLRAMRSSVQTGPEAVNQLLNEAIAHPGEETPEPIDALGDGALLAATLTRLIGQIDGGDEAAQAKLCELVYQELRDIGRRARHRYSDCSLATTEVVHEFLGDILADGRLGQMKNRRYFYAAAANQMRRLIIDHWRHKRTRADGGRLKREDLDPWLDELTDSAASRCGGDLEGLDLALERLKSDRPRQHEVALLKFFAGLTNAQAAEVLDISIDTVKRDWNIARARLGASLSEES